MGRHKVKKSKMQVIEQKQRWAISRNRKRKETYAKDPSYRKKVNTRNRKGYRQSHMVELRTCAENINRLEEFGQKRTYLLPDGTGEATELTFTVKELAMLIGGYHPIVLYRWHKEGKFPKPIFMLAPTEADSSTLGKVYNEGQALELLKIMAQHQQEKSYLHATDRETIRQLFDVMEEEKEDGGGDGTS